MQRFIDYIQNFISFTDDEVRLIKDHVYVEDIPSKSYILEAGNVSKRIGFILNGLVRAYFYDKDGNEIIRCFHSDNQFIGDSSSYNSQTASGDYIQTITNCSILFIRKESDEFFSLRLSKWLLLSRKLTEMVLMGKINNNIYLLHTDAKTKYLEFLKRHGSISQQIPLGYLASYLGITQQSLSRIRRNISL